MTGLWILVRGFDLKGKHMTTFRSVRHAPVRVRAASGVGVEDTTRADARAPHLGSAH